MTPIHVSQGWFFSDVGGGHSIVAIEQYEVSVNLTSTGGGASKNLDN